MKSFVATVAAVLAVSCSPAMVTPDGGNSPTDAGLDAGSNDAGLGEDAGVDAGDPADAGDKAATCAATFGQGLLVGFQRFDGTVLAVVPPNDQACAEPNSTHLVVQLTMAGAAYRMVVDVLSNQGNPDVFFDELDTGLVGPAWSDGWHKADLDYVTNLMLQSTDFTEMNEATVVAKITSELTLGTHVSIYATSGSTEPDSAHLVHRNLTNQDGAIVLNADGATPHWLLLRFDEQTF